jgi:hypothetical protein
MRLINAIGIDSRNGYRTFELLEGSLTEKEAAADLLVLSAYADEYVPGLTGVAGSLRHDFGLDVAQLPRELDLRGAFSLWISGPCTVGHFRRVMCLEFNLLERDLPTTIDNIFVGLAVLESKEMGIRSVAMPLLGAGNQRLDPTEVARLLLPKIRRALERSSCLSRVLFVERDHGRVQELDKAMNALLGRTAVTLPREKLIKGLASDICQHIAKLGKWVPEPNKPLLSDLVRNLSQKELRSFEVGMLGRRVCELVVNALVNSTNPREALGNKIKQLKNHGVADWIGGYLTNLQYFGNETAHENKMGDRDPPFLSEEDLTICLFCMRRVLEYWHSKLVKGAGAQETSP